MKTKSLILISLILIIGFVLGFLSSNYLRYRKMKEFRSYISVEGFRYHALKILEPNEEQKDKIVPVIDKFSKANQELRKKYKSEFIRLMKQYHNELDPLLTKEQLEKLKQIHSANSRSHSRRKSRNPGSHRQDGSGKSSFFSDPFYFSGSTGK